MSKYNAADGVFDLKKVGFLDWLLLGAFFSVLVFLGVVFYLPFLAERHYRDGFNFDAGQRYRYAIEEFEQAVSYAPWESQYWMALGRSYESAAEKETTVYEKRRLYGEALRAYEETLELDERNPWHHSRLGSVYLSLANIATDPKEAEADLQKAEMYTRKAAEVDSQNPLFQLNLAYFLHRLGRFDEALRYYEKTLSYDDRFAEAYYNMADIYRRRGATDNMLQAYLNVLEKAPEFPGIYVALSNFYMTQGQLAKAAPFLEKEIQQRPDYVEGIQNLAAIYYQLENWDRAAELYGQLVRFYPGDGQRVLIYAQCLVLNGRRDAALAELESFLAAYPTHAEVRNKYQQFVRAYSH